MTRTASTALGPNPALPPADPSGALARKRLLTAFALTPLLAGFYPALFLAEPIIMPISLVLSYTSTALFGVPLVLYFHSRGVRLWWKYIIGGAVCALPTVVLYALVSTPPEYLPPFGLMPVLGLLFWGASSGAIFWMIAIAGESPVGLRTLFDPFENKS